MSHIQLNYACLLFWFNFGESNWKILFLVKKLLSLKGALKYSENLFFLTIWKGANPVENLDLFKQMFLIKRVKGDKY